LSEVVRTCNRLWVATLHSDFRWGGVVGKEDASGDLRGRLGQTSISKSDDHRSLYRSDDDDKSLHRTALEGDRGGNTALGFSFLRKPCFFDEDSIISSSNICNDKDDTMEESVELVDVRRMNGIGNVMLCGKFV
jgi:hypothetical protein